MCNTSCTRKVIAFGKKKGEQRKLQAALNFLRSRSLSLSLARSNPPLFLLSYLLGCERDVIHRDLLVEVGCVRAAVTARDRIHLLVKHDHRLVVAAL